MVPFISKTSLLMVLAITSAMAQTAPRGGQESPRRNAASGSRQYSKSAVPEVEATAPEPTPIPAMAPEELPARSPRVSYRDGQLFVDSDNATLAEVLKAISRETGAQIEEPPNAGNERVAAHLSGPPRRVIERLLDDGKFGYIIVSPLQDQTGVQKVVLTSPTRSPISPISPVAQRANRRAAAPPPAEPSPDPSPLAEEQPSNQPQPSLAQSPATGDVAPPGDPAKPIPAGGEAQKPDNAMQTSQKPDSSQQQQAKTPMEILQDLYRRRQELQPQNQARGTQAQ